MCNRTDQAITREYEGYNNNFMCEVKVGITGRTPLMHFFPSLLHASALALRMESSESVSVIPTCQSHFHTSIHGVLSLRKCYQLAE